MKLFNNTKVPLLKSALDTYALRGRISASNIANINTPGYNAKRVEFEEELSKALQGNRRQSNDLTTHENHIPIRITSSNLVSPRISESHAENSINDDDLASGVNNVDIDQEMAELAKNQIRFKFAARMISGQFKGLQKSIRGQL